VVVHSEFLSEAVSKVFPGPVKRLFLAYDRTSSGTAPLSRRTLDLSDDKLVAVTIGHANSNKRILEVIEAIANSPGLAGRIVYVVLGLCEGPYGEVLRQAILTHGLQHTVRLMGQVSDDLLSSYLVHADVCVNLRYPAMEGASASVIEEMLYGKPVVVSNTGFFRELPSDGVIKITPGEEVEGLKRALAKLVSDTELRKKMGSHAQRFAIENSRASNYAMGFLGFAQEIMASKPILRFMDYVAMQLAAMGVPSDGPLVTAMAETAYELLCANARPPASSE
jgi:glycosyltransferase involved in cell wall biosynthesis